MELLGGVEMDGTVPSLLRELRKEARLGVREMVRALGPDVSVSTYAHYESPKFKEPELPKRWRVPVAKVLLSRGVPLERVKLLGNLDESEIGTTGMGFAAHNHLTPVKLIPVPLLNAAALKRLSSETFTSLRAGWSGEMTLAVDLGPETFAYRLECACMDHLIPKGATVFVDAGDTAPQEGGVYLIEHEGIACAREYREDGVARYVPRSSEDGHATFFPAVGAPLRVVGRVRSLLKSL